MIPKTALRKGCAYLYISFAEVYLSLITEIWLAIVFDIPRPVWLGCGP